MFPSTWAPSMWAMADVASEGVEKVMKAKPLFDSTAFE